MSHRDGRVTLLAWVDPVLRDHARVAAKSAGVEFSRWIERAVQWAVAAESTACALRDAEARQHAVEKMKRSATAIHRDVLVRALRRRCSSCGGNRYVHGYDGSEEGYQEECPGCHHSDAYDIADEIERGEWPQTTEGETK